MRITPWAAALAAGFWLTGSAAAKGPDFLVNSANDPGAGGCDAAECTLREAIDALNLKGSGSIGFDPAAFPHTPPTSDLYFKQVAVGSVQNDTQENNTNCGSNTWKKNVFGIASDSCVQ